MNVEQDRRKAAITRLQNRRAFGQNIVAYVVVNAFVVGIWFTTGAGYFWPAWLMAAWGMGLVMHAWQVYGQKPITEEDVEREIKRGGQSVA